LLVKLNQIESYVTKSIIKEIKLGTTKR
jgi:hypothetical protein